MSPVSLSLRELESRVGQEIAVSPWFEVTQDRIDRFAEVTEDWQWIHVDRERARQSPFGGTIAHGFLTLSLLPRLADSPSPCLAGFGLAWFLYIREPHWPARIQERMHVLYHVLVRKYGFDDLYQMVFAGGATRFGQLLWRFGDVKLIDGFMVNGTARAIGWLSALFRRVQSGYVYHYAFAMILGLFLLMSFFLSKSFFLHR